MQPITLRTNVLTVSTKCPQFVDMREERDQADMKLEIRGFERLSLRERQVVALKETGHSNDEIALRLGVSSSTVATLFSRARAKAYQVVLVLDGDPLGVHAPEPSLDDDLQVQTEADVQ